MTQTTRGAISPSTGRTLPDRYIEGTCPICGATDARGDQCDNCGNQLDPEDLINPVSKINGETPEFVDTEHFMLDLPALAEALTTWLKSRTDWRPNVLKFSLNLLENIRPRAMSRDIDWGVPIPIEGWQDNNAKKLYVWFDAVVGYLSASIEWPGAPAILKRGASGGTTQKPFLITSWVRTTSLSTPKFGQLSCWDTPVKALAVGKRATLRSRR